MLQIWQSNVCNCNTTWCDRTLINLNFSAEFIRMSKFVERFMNLGSLLWTYVSYSLFLCKTHSLIIISHAQIKVIKANVKLKTLSFEHFKDRNGLIDLNNSCCDVLLERRCLLWCFWRNKKKQMNRKVASFVNKVKANAQKVWFNHKMIFDCSSVSPAIVVPTLQIVVKER